MEKKIMQWVLSWDTLCWNNTFSALWSLHFANTEWLNLIKIFTYCTDKSTSPTQNHGISLVLAFTKWPIQNKIKIFESREYIMWSDIYYANSSISSSAKVEAKPSFDSYDIFKSALNFSSSQWYAKLLTTQEQNPA